WIAPGATVSSTMGTRGAAPTTSRGERRRTMPGRGSPKNGGHVRLNPGRSVPPPRYAGRSVCRSYPRDHRLSRGWRTDDGATVRATQSFSYRYCYRQYAIPAARRLPRQKIQFGLIGFIQQDVRTALRRASNHTDLNANKTDCILAK